MFENPTFHAYKLKMTKVHYTVLAICFVMNMCDGMNVMVIAYTANAIGKEWAINAADFGLVFSTGLLGMALGAMLLASKADIFGRKFMITICAVLMGSGVFITAFVESLSQLIILRLYTGIGIGSMLACTSTITAEYVPEKSKNFWVSFVMAGYPIGAVLSGLVATKIITNNSWQTMYCFAGAATLLTIPFIIFFLRESIEFLLTAQPINALQKVNTILAAMNLELLAKLPPKKIKNGNTTVTALFSRSTKGPTILLWLAFLQCFAGLYFLTSWIPKLASNAGLSITLSIYAGVFFNLGAFIGIITQGYLSAIFGLRKVICYFLASTALLMVLFSFFTGPTLTLILFCLIGFGMQGGFIGLYSVAARIYTTEIRGTGIGWAIGFGRLGAIIGPFIGGLIISSGASLHINFISFAIPVAMAGVVTLFIKSRHVT